MEISFLRSAEQNFTPMQRLGTKFVRCNILALFMQHQMSFVQIHQYTSHLCQTTLHTVPHPCVEPLHSRLQSILLVSIVTIADKVDMMLLPVGSIPSLQNSDLKRRINYSSWLQKHRRTTTPLLEMWKDLMGKNVLVL